MKLTIIVDDNAVYVDGVCRVLDLNQCNIPSNVHALQWYETEGEVEFDGKPKPANEDITALPVWANACVDKWNEAKVAEETIRALAEAAAKESVLTPIQ
jgi:hypothetical protein